MQARSRLMSTPVGPLAAAILLAVSVVACGSAPASTAPDLASPSAAPSNPVTSVAPSAVASAAPSPTPVPSGPATSTVAFVGDPAITGSWDAPVIKCQLPAVSGLQISVAGNAKNDANVYIVMNLTAGSVSVSLRAGAGATYTERDFQGTGVTGFDPAHGAQIDSLLTETTAAGGAKGTLGVATSLKGAIDCAAQQPGASTIHLTGTLPEGALDGGLSPVFVSCNTYPGGRNVGAQGIVMVGGTPVLTIVNVIADQFTVFLASSPTTHYLTAKGAGTGTLNGSTATLTGDAVSASAAGATVTVHATGTATCGS